uniref:Uncharacterized protein n=1 Tax=Arundo donax TaxID=35708 RepID=A0A0A9B8J1_ARUDO
MYCPNGTHGSITRSNTCNDEQITFLGHVTVCSHRIIRQTPDYTRLANIQKAQSLLRSKTSIRKQKSTREQMWYQIQEQDPSEANPARSDDSDCISSWSRISIQSGVSAIREPT